MSTLPTLPSGLKNAQLPQNSAGVVEPTVLTTDAKLALVVNGPGFKARDVISKEAAAERKEWAYKLLRDDQFTPLYLAQLAGQFQLDTAPLEQVLEKTRAMDYGQVGELSVQAAMYMNRMGKLPEPPKPGGFLARFRAQVEPTAEEMVNMSKFLTAAIEKWFRMRDDLLAPFTDVKVNLTLRYDQMVTQIVLNQQLAQNEDERTMTLTEYAALFEFIILAYPARMQELQASLQTAEDKKPIQNRINELTNMQPLVVKAINVLNPLIFTGNAAFDRYLQLINMAGGRALVLGLFLTACIARWESDVVTEVLELQQLAADMAMTQVEEFMNEQASRSSAGMVELTRKYVDLMNRWVVSMQHMQEILDNTQEAKNILASGFRELVKQHGQVTSAVQDAMSRMESGNEQFHRDMEAAASSGNF